MEPRVRLKTRHEIRTGYELLYATTVREGGTEPRLCRTSAFSLINRLGNWVVVAFLCFCVCCRLLLMYPLMTIIPWRDGVHCLRLSCPTRCGPSMLHYATWYFELRAPRSCDTLIRHQMTGGNAAHMYLLYWQSVIGATLSSAAVTLSSSTHCQTHITACGGGGGEGAGGTEPRLCRTSAFSLINRLGDWVVVTFFFFFPLPAQPLQHRSRPQRKSLPLALHFT
jgi:hypothetical protein